MDTLTLAVFGIFAAILVARVVEIAIKRPRTFLELTGDLRKFADPANSDALAAKTGEVVNLRRSPTAASSSDYERRLSA